MNPSPSLPTLNRLQPIPQTLIGWFAMLWGWCIVMPVGMQYLCLFALLILLLVSGRYKQTIAVFAQEKVWAWSAGLFLGITLLTLAMQAQYFKETPSNLWHGFRIVLTLMVGLSLTAQEAKKALLSAVAALSVMSLWVVAHWAGWLQHAPAQLLKLIPQGNEWIAMSILLAMLAIACLRLCQLRHRSLLLLIFLAVAALVVNMVVMNQRTAFVALAAGVACLALAWWRARLKLLLPGLIGITAIFAAILLNVDAVNAKFKTGLTELDTARTGVVNQESMNVRYHMYTKTADMLLERPAQGWGIGSWNAQWKKRIDPILHSVNMPHNDFLWMGAQAGWPGALSWLALMLSACWMAWQRRNAAGHIAFAVSAMALVSSLVNSATRDASIGLPMLFVLSACLAWALGSEGGDDSSQHQSIGSTRA